MKSSLLSLSVAALGGLPLGCLGAAVPLEKKAPSLVPRKGDWEFTQVPEFFTWSRELFGNRDIPQKTPEDFWINEKLKYDEAGFEESRRGERSKWASLGEYLAKLNEQDEDVQYKLLYLMRHGKSYHNVHHYPWEGFPEGSPEFEPYVDDLLIQQGVDTARATGRSFEEAVRRLDMPVPQEFVSSPLRRVVQTAAYAFGSWSAFADVTIMERLRPRTDDLPWVFRSTRAAIEACVDTLRRELGERLPFKFEAGFAETDPVAGSRGQEDDAARVRRIGLWLSQIFTDEAHRSKTVMAVVTHRKVIQGIDQASAAKGLPKLQPPNSAVIPMVIKATRK